MSPREFLSYMISAAEDGVLISAEQLNRLQQMDPKSRAMGARFPPGSWYEVDVRGIKPAVARARAELDAAEAGDGE